MVKLSHEISERTELYCDWLEVLLFRRRDQSEGLLQTFQRCNKSEALLQGSGDVTNQKVSYRRSRDVTKLVEALLQVSGDVTNQKVSYRRTRTRPTQSEGSLTQEVPAAASVDSFRPGSLMDATLPSLLLHLLLSQTVRAEITNLHTLEVSLEVFHGHPAIINEPGASYETGYLTLKPRLMGIFAWEHTKSEGSR